MGGVLWNLIGAPCKRAKRLRLCTMQQTRASAGAAMTAFGAAIRSFSDLAFESERTMRLTYPAFAIAMMLLHSYAAQAQLVGAPRPAGPWVPLKATLYSSDMAD